MLSGRQDLEIVIHRACYVIKGALPGHAGNGQNETLFTLVGFVGFKFLIQYSLKPRAFLPRESIRDRFPYGSR